MADKDLKVADGMVVSLDYTLRLEDDEVIDSSEGQEPLEFLQGEGQIINGLEQALYGMTIGEEKEVVVEPTLGYGEADPDDFQLVPHDVFPDDVTLSPGMMLRMRDGESGQAVEATVTDVLPDGVLLDLNHPLAGETLRFHVKIADLRPATGEELEHGHVHTGDTH